MFDVGEEIYLGNENIFDCGCISSSLIFIDGVAILLLKKSHQLYHFATTYMTKRSWEVLR